MAQITQLTLKQHKGYYLIEVLITFIIIGIGILALLRLHSTTVAEVSLNKQRIEATTIAKAKLEELRNFQVITTTSGYKAFQDIVSSATAEAIAGNNTTYSRTWIVTTSTSPSYKTVTVTVSWTSQLNVNQQVQLSTIIAEDDPATSASVINP